MQAGRLVRVFGIAKSQAQNDLRLGFPTRAEESESEFAFEGFVEDRRQEGVEFGGGFGLQP